jgi:hypothetical protein
MAHLCGTKMRPARSQNVGSGGNTPLAAWRIFLVLILRIFSTGMIECNFIRWGSGNTGLVQ